MENNPILQNLSPELKSLVLEWIEVAIEEDLTWNRDQFMSIIPRVIECLREWIHPVDEDYEEYVSLDELVALQNWDGTIDENDWARLVGGVLHNLVSEGRVKPPPIPQCRSATEDQIRIIKELQEEEPDIRFDFCFPRLTSWMAHVIIQGLVAMSEVQRNTGRREFRPGELRKAIREYIQRKKDV